MGKSLTAANALSHQSHPLRGMGLMVLATLTNAVMIASIHHLSHELHPFVIAFFRSLFGLLLFAPLFFRRGFAPLRTSRLPLHALRGILNVTAMLLFFLALSLAPLAKVTALNFSAPLFSTLLALLLLQERIRLRRLTALAIGFAGTLIIVRPGSDALDEGAMLVLLSAMAWGAAMIVIKMLSRTESSLTITVYLGVFVTPIAALAAIPFWDTPNAMQFAWLICIAIFGTASNILMAQAFREADATVVLPLDFTKLIWAAAIGYFVFGQVPDLWTWAGAALIIFAVTYIAYRESVIERKVIRH